MTRDVTAADTIVGGAAAGDAGRIWPVILSGGAGSRLWPLSRQHSPKQLLPLGGPESMIRATAARVATANFHPPIVVTGAVHAELVRQQLGPAALLLVEPAARNTAPAIALAMLAVAARDPDGLVLVMPSDHVVGDPEALNAAVKAAVPAADDDWLVTFGITPTRPETGFGYIRAGDALWPGVRRAEAFVEKPPLATARAYLADGRYSWNAGIFLFRVAAMRAALAAHAPAILAAAEAAMAGARQAPDRIDPDAAAFALSPGEAIDTAVFEKAGRVAVCPVSPGWSDIGSWDALFELGPADADRNVGSGRTLAIDTAGCLLRAEGVTLATIGVQDLSVIATPDAVLVAARGRSQEVKAIVGQLAGDPLLARPVHRQEGGGADWLVHDGDGITVHKYVLDRGARRVVTGRIMLIAGGAERDGQAMVPGELQPGGTITTAQGATLLHFATPG